MAVQIVSDARLWLKKETKLHALAAEMDATRKDMETLVTRWGGETFESVVDDLRNKSTRTTAEGA